MRSQPLLIRITHWVTVPLLVVLVASGVEIFRAYPYFGPRGETWDWIPLQGIVGPEPVRMGGWLASARNLHVYASWFFTINAFVYATYVLATGEFRKRWYWPQPGKYTSLQRLAYTFVVVLVLLVILSGFALWKPVQLSWLATALGGYDVARVIHFYAMIGLVAFTAGHVISVLLRPRTLIDMITGGKREAA